MTESETTNGTGCSSPQVSSDIARLVKIAVVCGCIVFALIFLLMPIIGAYNALVDSDLQVQRAASNIKTDMERRADLLPNLAATVQGSATFEYKTLTDVTLARAGESTKLKKGIASTSATDINALEAQNSQMTSILGNFVKLQEQYPTLQTTQQFREFSAQVTATENEILVDRQTYNAAVMQYKSVVSTFPSNLVANHFGFNVDRYQMYVPKDQARAEAVPTITFDFSSL